MKTDFLPPDHYFVLVATAQIGKLFLILSQPDTHLFLNWFLGFTHHRPYEGYFPLIEGGPATSFVDYSAIWYFFYYPTFYGYHAWFLFSWCIELLFLAVVYKNHGQLYTLYVLQLSFLFSLNSPQDFLPYLLIVVGRIRWQMLPLAIAVKLPLLPPVWSGAANDPAAVWNFILYSPVALHASSNWVRYGALTAAWIISLTLYLRDHRWKFTEVRKISAFLRDHRHIRLNSPHIPLFLRRALKQNANTPRTTGDRHWPRARRDGSDVHLVRLNGSRRIHQRASLGDHHTTDLRCDHTLRRSPALPPRRKERAWLSGRSDRNVWSWRELCAPERVRLRSLYSLNLHAIETRSSQKMRLRVPVFLDGILHSKIRFSTVALLLTLSILGFTAALSTPSVHAAGVVFKAKASNPNGFSPMSVGPLTVALGDALIVTVMWYGTGGVGTVTDSQGNKFTLAVQSNTGQSSGANSAIWDAIAGASGSDTVTVTRGTNAFVAAFLDYSGVASFGQTATQQLDSAGASGSSIVSLTNVATSSWIVENFFYETGGASGSVTVNNAQVLRDGMSTSVCATNGFGNCNTYDVLAPASGFSLSLSYSSNSCASPGCFASHSALELLAGVPSNIQIVDRCFGNCGAPPVTVVGTNSTHSLNFNQSITVFYIAQSSLNGFVENVTTQVAKTYANGETIAIGLYTVDPVCTASNNPFTPQCPGFLVQKQGLTTNPSRGAFTMASTVAIQNGQWFGLAVTGGFQGLDLNDTNTNVVLNQAAGQIPTVITQYSGLGASKLALYGFVRGNSIIIGPPSGQIGPGCQTVTCGILALWAALGGDVAAGIGGFLIVLGLVVGFMLYISRQHNPDGSIRGFAVPVEFLGIIAVAILIMFSAAGAIPAWIPGVIIFLVAGFFVAGLWGRRHHSNTVQG